MKCARDDDVGGAADLVQQRRHVGEVRDGPWVGARLLACSRRSGRGPGSLGKALMWIGIVLAGLGKRGVRASAVPDGPVRQRRAARRRVAPRTPDDAAPARAVTPAGLRAVRQRGRCGGVRWSQWSPAYDPARRRGPALDVAARTGAMCAGRRHPPPRDRLRPGEQPDPGSLQGALGPGRANVADSARPCPRGRAAAGAH
jgi:hypothetical protein